MSAKLTKEELMEKIKDIENDEEPEKKFGELTEEDLRNVSGGFTLTDGRELVCPDCGCPDVIPIISTQVVYCPDCRKCVKVDLV